MAERHDAESSSVMETTPSDSTLNQDSREFHPIKSNGATIPSGNRVISRNSNQQATSLRTISRTRSHNGYGCDDLDDGPQERDGGDVENKGSSLKDPYEVAWENGESDPANPRSMTHARKWLVVLIVSASSLCV